MDLIDRSALIKAMEKNTILLKRRLFIVLDCLRDLLSPRKLLMNSQ